VIGLMDYLIWVDESMPSKYHPGQQIKKQYRKMALQHHPDKQGPKTLLA